jgi:5'-nucleotidase
MMLADTASLRKMLRSTLIGAALAAAASPSHALKIMLVNDDGCNAPGINVLADALEAQGHTVGMYAPASDQSGQGSRQAVISGTCLTINFGIGQTDLSNVTTSAANRLCVTATTAGCKAPFPPPFTADAQTVSASPFESTLVGLQKMTGSDVPDLVISGINRGENVGAVTNNSGTVGAAVAAIRNGIPAIAVSLGVPYPDDRYAAAAQVVVHVIERLQQEANGGPLLPAQTGLNINYPGSGTPKGILYTNVGSFSTIGIGPRVQSDGSVKIGFTIDNTPQGTPVEQISDEGIALREGYISISTIDGDWNAVRAKREDAKLRLNGIKP